MHEQIVQKKIDGKLRLQKIQVPMKICSFKPDAEYLDKLATYPNYDNLPKQDYLFTCNNVTYAIPYTISNGKLENIQPSKYGPAGKYFEFFIKSTDRGILTLELPNKLINIRNSTSVDFILSGNDKLKTPSVTTTEFITLKIPFEKNTSKIDVYPSTLSSCLHLLINPKMSDDLLKMIHSEQKMIEISISGNGTVPDFRPTKSSGMYYGMPELTQEQRDLVVAKSSAYIKNLQKDLVKFIINNGGKVKYQDIFRNSLTAEIPTTLIKKLEKRNDVIFMQRADQKIGINDCRKGPC